VIPFIIGIHRGVALATSDRRAAFDHIILFHLVYEGVIGAVEIGNIFTGFKIKAGKHMKHGSNLFDIRQREYKGDWVTILLISCLLYVEFLLWPKYTLNLSPIVTIWDASRCAICCSMNDRNYPWLILVPDRADVREDIPTRCE
jgi:hypothetical protein